MDCVNDTKSKKGVKTEMMSDRGEEGRKRHNVPKYELHMKWRRQFGQGREMMKYLGYKIYK